MNVKRVLTTHRHSLAAAIAVPAVLGIASCGAVPVSPSASPSTVTVAPPATSEPTSAAPATTKHPRSTQSRPSETKAPQTRPCHPSEVDVRFDPSNYGDLTEKNKDSNYFTAELKVTNTGGSECDVTGYPDIQALDSQGKPLPMDVRKFDVGSSKPVILEPGWTGSATIQFTGSHQQQPCTELKTAQIALPGNKEDVTTVQWVYGGVCGGLDVVKFGPR